MQPSGAGDQPRGTRAGAPRPGSGSSRGHYLGMPAQPEVVVPGQVDELVVGPTRPQRPLESGAVAGRPLLGEPVRPG